MAGEVPVEISREGATRIRIRWSDGMESLWEAGDLRKVCPCATCREKKGGKEDRKGGRGLEVIPMKEAVQMRVEGMRPIGNYAYAIEFSDGHSSGIFGFDVLRTPEVRSSRD
jgi:DUF971 family protein